MAYIFPPYAAEKKIEVVQGEFIGQTPSIDIKIGEVGNRLTVSFSVEEFRDLMTQGAAALQAVSEKEVA